MGTLSMPEVRGGSGRFLAAFQLYGLKTSNQQVEGSSPAGCEVSLTVSDFFNHPKTDFVNKI
jgi:hypothetical protein